MAKFSMQQQNYSHEMSATRVAVIYVSVSYSRPRPSVDAKCRVPVALAPLAHMSKSQTLLLPRN